MLTLNWIIEWMECKPVQGDYTDVVITAGWRCDAVDGIYNATSYGSSTFAEPTSNFTPYNQLTQDQVLGWVWAAGVNKDTIEANLTKQIEDQQNPPVVQLPLPWASN